MLKYFYVLDFDKTIIDFDSFNRIVFLTVSLQKKVIFLLLSFLHKLKIINNFRYKSLVSRFVLDFLDVKNRALISKAISKMAKGQPNLNIIDQLPLNSEVLVISATYTFIVREFLSHYELQDIDIKVFGDDFDFFPGFSKGEAVQRFISKPDKLTPKFSSIISFSDSLSDLSLCSVSNIFYLVKGGKIINEFKCRR